MKKQKTAMTELLDHCQSLLARGQQVDTQALVEWIENSLLLTEEGQIVEAYKAKFGGGTDPKWKTLRQEQAEQYYESKYGKDE